MGAIVLVQSQQLMSSESHPFFLHYRTFAHTKVRYQRFDGQVVAFDLATGTVRCHNKGSSVRILVLVNS